MGERKLGLSGRKMRTLAGGYSRAIYSARVGIYYLLLMIYYSRIRPFRLRFATMRLDGRGFFIVTGFVLGFIGRFFLLGVRLVWCFFLGC